MYLHEAIKQHVFGQLECRCVVTKNYVDSMLWHVKTRNQVFRYCGKENEMHTGIIEFNLDQLMSLIAL